MRIILFGLLLLLFSCSGNHKPVGDCSKLRNGIFKMVFDGKTDIIIRKDNFQTEIMDGKKSSSYTVDWTDSCTYTLTPTATTLQNDPNIPKDAVITVTITKVNGNSYNQNTTTNFSDQVMPGEIVKIK